MSSSSSLWVGNLSGDVTEAELTNIFGKYGAIVKITLYSSKYFAFVHFKLPQDAKSAKDSLNASLLRGSPLKIDFAKPVCAFLPTFFLLCIFLFVFLFTSLKSIYSTFFQSLFHIVLDF